MAGPKAQNTTVAGFISGVPDDRRQDVERVRSLVLKHLPPGYEEVVSKGMLVYQVPRSRYSDTYNGHPLWYAALGVEKSYLSLHLMPVYGSPVLAQRLADGFRAARKTLRMGKACVRFKSADDLALDAIGEVIRSVPIEQWIEIARGARRP